MRSYQLLILIFLLGFNLTVFSHVTSYKFDPNKVNVELANKMGSLHQEDQKYRLAFSKLTKEKAAKELLDSIKITMKEKDRSNLLFNYTTRRPENTKEVLSTDSEGRKRRKHII